MPLAQYVNMFYNIKTMFKLDSKFNPTGDQPEAIKKLSSNLIKGVKHQTLWGVTGSGKTFTMANVIKNAGKPTLVIAHNKTLAAQLADEFREFFPENAVHYFVSYYDYYQPEAYIPHSDTYIEKDSSINDEIDRLRHAATHALLTRKDVIIVASVSCIYGIGSPEFYIAENLLLETKKQYRRNNILKSLGAMHYDRNDTELKRGTFSLRGEILEIFPAYTSNTYRIQFFGDEIEEISEIDWITGKTISKIASLELFPAKHFITPENLQKEALKKIRRDLKIQIARFRKQNKLLEAQRIEERTNYDLEMIEQTGFCSGIENYSRYFDGRKPGQVSSTLIDYFPKDFLMVIDESHITVPQIGAMHAGDRARKEKLVDFGFRLPSAFDNRPLKFEEFYKKINKVIFTTATPSEYELDKSSAHNIVDDLPKKYDAVIRQFIRPTGLLDPEVEVRKTKGQIDDLVSEIEKRTSNNQRVLVTTLTKKMAEALTEYLAEKKIRVAYIHSDVGTLERIEILRSLRAGDYDVLVGINLLREGLDLPEVSLVAILDADKEGFLRSRTSLIQTIGRAARHREGKVIMYADDITESMRIAIEETTKRRKLQRKYNKVHNITPKTIIKSVKEKQEAKADEAYNEIDKIFKKLPKQEKRKVIADLNIEMHKVAAELKFERAAELRDQIAGLESML